MTGILDGAFKACALACIGEWTGRGKTISIAERSGGLVLQMGPETPTLQLQPTSSAETWPMQWNATRLDSDSKEPIYFIELPTPISPRLLVRRPVGDSVIEFLRAGMEPEPGNGLAHATSPGGGQQLALIDGQRHSRSSSRSTPRRPRSPAATADAKDGSSGFKPGDWTCKSCNFHNFARNLSCKSCSSAKPKSAGTQDTSGHDSLVTRIKRGQRESEAFKKRWWDFCDRKGGGFYDPVRHDTRLLEEFLSAERGGRGGSRSRGRSRKRSRSRSGSRSYSTKRSRSRSRRRHRKRKRHKRSKAHRKHKKSHRTRRKKRAKKRKRSSSSHASSAPASSASTAPGMPSRKTAIKATERAIADAEKALEEARKAAEPVAAEVLQEAEEKQKAEVAKKIDLARQRVDEEMKQRLREAEAKLQEEKAAQLRDSEQKLDAVIASRVKDAQERLRKEVDARIAEHRNKITPAAGVEAARKVQAEAAAKVQAAESRLQQARSYLASLKPVPPALPAPSPAAVEAPVAEKGSDPKEALALQDGEAESSSSSSSSSSAASEAPEPDASATVLR